MVNILLILQIHMEKAIQVFYSQSEIKCEKSFVMLSAHFQWKLHSIMTIHQEFFRKSILFYYRNCLEFIAC
ncbi:hypothetical protein B5F78_09935 [Bacteroides sp. An279]|nr:hypothetical protein B5F78_09935 [Bacteroides sp. An279]